MLVNCSLEQSSDGAPGINDRRGRGLNEVFVLGSTTTRGSMERRDQLGRFMSSLGAGSRTAAWSGVARSPASVKKNRRIFDLTCDCSCFPTPPSVGRVQS